MKKKPSTDRRRFLQASVGSAAALLAASNAGKSILGAGNSMTEQKSPIAPQSSVPVRIKYAVIGINHDHIHGQIDALKSGGGELVAFYAKEPDLAAAFSKRYPEARLVSDEKEILEDPAIKLVASSGIPIDRAPLGIRVMKHGKDYLSDKPGIITLEQLADVRKVQRETGRIYSIMYSERFGNRATVAAGELTKSGAIGRVLQTIGLGPHRINPKTRPAWFFEHDKYGGILCDVGSHQIDQFLFFTNTTSAEVTASQVGNVHHPQFPGLDDFGDVMLAGNGGAGYVRVDWFTPDGLPTWGDVRLTILGSDGYIEVRKNVDIGGRTGGDHLFLVDQKGIRYVDCSKQELPFGRQLIDDVLNRTETAMTQAHCLLATELALKAQKNAKRLNQLG